MITMTKAYSHAFKPHTLRPSEMAVAQRRGVSLLVLGSPAADVGAVWFVWGEGGIGVWLVYHFLGVRGCGLSLSSSVLGGLGSVHVQVVGLRPS